MGVAGFGAFAAGFCATLAVLMLVLTAFFGAVAADGFAFCKHLVRKLAVSQQQTGREEADVRAIPVQLNAVRHRRYVILVKAGCGAGFAMLGAMQQRINELLMLVAAVVV